MVTMATTNVGIVGAGWMGQTHGQAWHNNAPRARVAAVADVSPARAQAISDRFAGGRAKIYPDLESLLGDPDIEAVDLCLPHHLHRSAILAAAAAGKHVLCEKPLALTLADAWAMVDACDRERVTLAVDHHLPAAGTHRTMRDLVASGAIGEPLAVRVFHAVSLPERLQGWRLTAPDRGAGVILDITCHDAAAVDAILGRDALEAAAVALRQGPWETAVEDAVVTSLRYDGDVLVQTHDAFTVAHAGTGLEIHGTEGSIVATDVMTQEPSGRVVLRTGSGQADVEPVDRRDLYEVTLEAFGEAVAGAEAPIVDGPAGVRALAVALAVKEAAESGTTVPVAVARSGAGTS
jgi:1,5-anhydro-D-fructose reductase (1,5-anhydro-D-mannitol-forming)